MTTLERPQPKLSMAAKAARIDAICEQARILPVITIAREEDILPLADALAAGGIRTLEVTLRSQHGLKAIQVLREQRPELCVGAGTVLDRSMFAAVEAAGAQFVVTPGITQDILKAGVDSEIPLLPGISTPSEIMMGYALATAGSSCSRPKSAAAWRRSRPLVARSAIFASANRRREPGQRA